MRLCAQKDGGHILSPKVTSFDECVRGVASLAQVLVPASIALVDRQARIARGLARGLRRSKRHVGSEQGKQLIRRADLGLSKIPSGDCGERHGYVR